MKSALFILVLIASCSFLASFIFAYDSISIGPTMIQFFSDSININVRPSTGASLLELTDLLSEEQITLRPHVLTCTVGLYPLIQEITKTIGLMNGWQLIIKAGPSNTPNPFSFRLVPPPSFECFSKVSTSRYSSNDLLKIDGLIYLSVLLSGYSLLIMTADLPRNCFFGQDLLVIKRHGLPINDTIYGFQVDQTMYYLSVYNEDRLCVFAIRIDLLDLLCGERMVEEPLPQDSLESSSQVELFDTDPHVNLSARFPSYPFALFVFVLSITLASRRILSAPSRRHRKNRKSSKRLSPKK